MVKALEIAVDRACGIHIIESLDDPIARSLGLARLKAKCRRDGTFDRFEITAGIVPVIVYLRCSTAEQKDAASLQQQLRAIAWDLLELGYFVVAFFWDDDTGKNYDRPGLKAARAYAERHIARGMFVWVANRFGRNHIDGMVVARELSRNGCPLWHRRSASSRYRIGNTDNIEDQEDLSAALLDAEADLGEHEFKTQRGQRNLLLQCAWPFGRFPISLFYETREEGPRKAAIQRVILRPEAGATLNAIVEFLKQDPSLAILRALASTFDVREQLLLRDLRSHRLIGILDTPKIQMDDNHHPGLQLLSKEQFDFLQAYLSSAAPARAAPTLSTNRELLKSASAAEIYFVSEGQLGLVCRECGAVAAPDPGSGLEYLDRDVWVCPKGHRLIGISERIKRGLAFNNKSHCVTCGNYEFWERKGPVKFQGREWLHVRCKKCHTEILCTHEVDPILKRMMRKNRRPMGFFESTRKGGQQLLSYFRNAKGRLLDKESARTNG